MRITIVLALLTLTGCGYYFSPKEIIAWDAKGEKEIAFACGPYMHVSSHGWINSSYDVTFSDIDGLTHDAYGLKQVAVTDIPPTVNAPMWGFGDYSPGDRYRPKSDGSLGEIIKDGDIVSIGESKAQLLGGKWVPVKVPNKVCLAK